MSERARAFVVVLRRFLVLAALMFWQGGFVFYAGIVVPIGTEVLGSELEQGFITRHVAVSLNLAGAVALLPLCWDAVAGRDPSRWRRRTRWLACAGMLITLVLLIWLHPRMGELLVAEGRNKRIDDYERFTTMHRVYLWTITVQWAFGVVYAFLSVWSWWASDRMGKPSA